MVSFDCFVALYRVQNSTQKIAFHYFEKAPGSPSSYVIKAYLQAYLWHKRIVVTHPSIQTRLKLCRYNMELSRIYLFPLYLTDTKFRPLSGFIFGGIGSEVRRPIVFGNEIGGLLKLIDNMLKANQSFIVDMWTFQHAITGYKVVYDQ